MRRYPIAALTLALAVSCHANAIAEEKLPVAFSATANDSVGRQLAFHFRDQIGRSGSFTLSNDAILKVSIVTMDPDDGGNQTIYNYTFLIKGDERTLDSYLSGGVGVCGKQRVQSCAINLMTSLGEQVELIRQAISGAQKSDFR